MGFSRQEYRSGLPCPSLGDFPDAGVEMESLMSPVLAVPPGRPTRWFFFLQHVCKRLFMAAVFVTAKYGNHRHAHI